MMPLVIEDGSGVPNANTYASLDAVKAYALARGASLPSDDAAVSSLIIQAMDYVESFRARFKGTKTYPTSEHPARQFLQWPRVGVVIDGACWPADELPDELTSALCQCVIEVNNASGEFFASSSGAAVVKREKVDVIETEYMTATDTGITVGAQSYPKIDWLLSVLLDDNGAMLKSIRV